MTTIKIIILAAVVGVIGFFLWKSYGGFVKSPDSIKPPRNQFTDRIEDEIDSIRRVRTDVFCKQYYDAILYHITDYHKQGFLGKSTADNDQWRDFLSKDLYSGYAPKFAAQALYVFSHPTWEINDLNFIRREVNLLQKYSLLDRDSPVSDSLGDVRTILSKYDEIVGFISSCRNFSYTDYSIDASFPINEAGNKIQKSRNYLSNSLDNSYVNNCTRLKDGLRETPEALFNKHINYLRSKIQEHSDKYGEYVYQIDYSNKIYQPLNGQINGVDNDIYGVGDDIFQNSQNALVNLLDTDNDHANTYFRSKIN